MPVNGKAEKPQCSSLNPYMIITEDVAVSVPVEWCDMGVQWPFSSKVKSTQTAEYIR